ncbi:hypothetical protein KIPB_014864, partial [Kipferlia bialata]|eukprot:g14864.t1
MSVDRGSGERERIREKERKRERRVLERERVLREGKERVRPEWK